MSLLQFLAVVVLPEILAKPRPLMVRLEGSYRTGHPVFGSRKFKFSAPRGAVFHPRRANALARRIPVPRNSNGGAEPRARALGAPPPPCRCTTSWGPMIAKLAGVVPNVTLSNLYGSVSPVPGKTENFAPMLLHCSFETTWRNLCASKNTHALGPQILRCFLANVSDLSSFSS